MIETIEWVACSERLPDDNTSVLIGTDGTSEPVWIGYRDVDRWLDTEGFEVNVMAWAPMPAGPHG